MSEVTRNATRASRESNFHFSLARLLGAVGSRGKMSFRAIQFLAISALVATAIGCKKVPPKILNHGRKQSGDNGYRLVIGGNPSGYEPGKIYNCELLLIEN